MKELLIANLKRTLALLEKEDSMFQNIKKPNRSYSERNKDNTELSQRLKEIRRDSLLLEKEFIYRFDLNE